jgi:hypothetical protein
VRKKEKKRVKISKLKKLLGLEKPLQIRNNLLNTSPFNNKKGPPQKNLSPNRRKRLAIRLRLKRKSRWPPKTSHSVRNPSSLSVSGRRQLTLSLSQLLMCGGDDNCFYRAVVVAMGLEEATYGDIKKLVHDFIIANK